MSKKIISVLLAVMLTASMLTVAAVSVFADVVPYLSVNVTSNIFPEQTTTYSADTQEVKVSFVFQSNKNVLNTQWELHYDPEVLSVSTAKNRPANIAPVTRGVINVEKDAETGVQLGTVYGNASDLGLYDFTEAAPLVTVTFDVVEGAVVEPVSTNVNFMVQILTTSEYDDDGYADESKDVVVVKDFELIATPEESGIASLESEVTPSTYEVPTEPETEEPTTVEPTTEEPTTEEPTTEEPTTEEPTTEEPTAEEVTTEEPTTEEPTTEEATTEEATTEEPATEEPTTVEPTTEEPTTEDPATATEEPTTEESTTEAAATEEPTTEEPTTEPDTQDPISPMPTTEEPTTEEITTEEPTTVYNGVLKVTATSNFFPETSKTYNSDTNQVVVRYYLNTDKDLLNTQWTLKYDSSVLTYSSANSVATVMPNCSDGALVNATTPGEIFGAVSNLNLFDFSSGDEEKTFVEVVFDVADGVYSSDVETTVDLCVEVLTFSLASADSEYEDEAEEVLVVTNSVVDDEAAQAINVIVNAELTSFGDVEEPTTEEPTTEEPTTEEPTTEEPTTEEPTTEEPTTEEPTTEAPTTEEPTTEEPTTEAPATEEPTADEPATGGSETTAPTEETTAADATSSTGVQVDGTSTNDTPSGNAPVKTGDASMALIVLLALVSSCTVAYFARKRVK